MSDQVGEKTEQPTPRRLEEARKRGQFARSAEIQTVCVMVAGFAALAFTGPQSWRTLAEAMVNVTGHLHEIPLTTDALQSYAVRGTLLLGACVWPILAATAVAGLLAGGAQSRFQTASEVLEVNWGRLDPVEGFKRVFSGRSLVPMALAVGKLAIVIMLSYHVIRQVLSDPIFYTAVDVARIAAFMASSAYTIAMRVAFALAVIAAIDYAYQFWRTHHDLMMTKEEVKEEAKNSEANPQIRARLRRRRTQATQRRMMIDVPRADVVVTNPTHLAIALRYDRKAMRAPRVLAKGSRLNAQRIKEIAQRHQVPVVENKPLARLLFKYWRVGGEIPAQLYGAVAEILAWVYRINAYRYYREQHGA